jgi:hypothetical protein
MMTVHPVVMTTVAVETVAATVVTAVAVEIAETTATVVKK